MRQPPVNLDEERGRLLERIRQQRSELTANLQPLAEAAHSVQRLLGTARRGADYLRQHPEMVTAAVAVAVIVRPSRVWRWARRGFFLWRIWRIGRGILQTVPETPASISKAS